MIASPKNTPAYKLPEDIEAELILYDIVVKTFNEYFWGRLIGTDLVKEDNPVRIVTVMRDKDGNIVLKYK